MDDDFGAEGDDGDDDDDGFCLLPFFIIVELLLFTPLISTSLCFRALESVSVWPLHIDNSRYIKVKTKKILTMWKERPWEERASEERASFLARKGAFVFGKMDRVLLLPRGLKAKKWHSEGIYISRTHWNRIKDVCIAIFSPQCWRWQHEEAEAWARRESWSMVLLLLHLPFFESLGWLHVPLSCWAIVWQATCCHWRG